MGWFDEQLKIRRKADDESFVDSIVSVANAVMGQKLAQSLSDQEVAASAIETILKYYHFKMKTDDIPPSFKSLDDQIEFYMRPYGIMRRTVELSKGWYRNAVGAMLGTLKENGKAVALIPHKISGYYFVDLETGKRVKVSRKNEGLFDTEATAFYQPLPMKSLNVSDLLKFMAKTYSVSDVVMYVGMMAVMSVLGLLAPQFTKWLFGDVLRTGNTTVLMALAGFMLCYTVSKLLLSTYQTLINSRITTKQNIAVQAAVMSRVMSLPPKFFRGYASGELSQYAGSVQNLCSTMVNSIGQVGLTSAFSLIYLGQIFSYAPSLVVPSLLITVSTVVLSTITTLIQMKYTKLNLSVSAKTNGLAYATIRGIQKIKLAGAEKRMFARWANNYAEEANLQYNKPFFLKISSVIASGISMAGTIVLYYLAVKNRISVDNYYAFNASYGQISGAFAALSSIATTFATIKPTLDSARPIMEAEPEISEGKMVVDKLRGNIELSHVSFRYDDSMPNIIDDLSLQIKAGEYLAIVGSTGCGKSTLMRLLLGFESPQKGSIFYDRKDISKIDLKSLRKNIGTVMQDGKLFLGDIFSNIIISAPQLTLNEAWEAAEIADIADDIRAMPMGMHTIISEGQGGISGGQRQRLMIARAVAPKPKILMFDEATSALDNMTQKKVSDAIDSLKCTRIVIAHRLSTIRHADRIIYLEKGKVAEQGTYEELIELNGKFAELVERQRLDID
ncbi:MAG: ATP-binding cassette domain-containing protein [Clostridia bacterium]|nr:ATP-binding cassette domain-containing protein [Clostridia bacterium]